MTIKKAWDDDFGKKYFWGKPREQHEHNNFIPSPYKVVTEYENAFIKEWNETMAAAFVEVLKYMATATKTAIKTNLNNDPDNHAK
jgi:hypothetical protein